MKKKIAFIMAIILLTGTNMAVAAEKLSISDLRVQTAEKWTQTYQAHGREITINIPIEIPSVETVPVFVSDSVPNSNVEQSIPNHYQPLERTFKFGFRNDEYVFAVGANNPFVSLDLKGGKACPESYVFPYEIDWNRSYAEANPTTAQEAWDFFMREYERCYGLGSSEDIFLNHILLRGILREYNDRTKEFGATVREKGSYSFLCFQKYYGIPALASISSSFVGNSRNNEKAFAIWIDACIANENEFNFMFMRRDVKEKKIDDIPLISFDSIKRAYEELIEKGQIRNIYSMRFAYVLFEDKKDKNTIWYFPCWVAECDYFSSAKEDLNPMFADGPLYRSTPNFGPVIVNAQTGELFNPKDSSKNRSICPTILTW